ncbi:MAG: L-seryl-tRNA(Sec) selenium transferase, partial [Actinomycetota bacterium]|nr:L-seryl-tRNA(Sec) selenium transferase [Actinomycetota bacterium]
MSDPRRVLPSVDTLLRSPPGRRAAARFGRAVVRHSIQRVVEEVRGGLGRGRAAPDADALMARAVGMAARMSFGLSPVINATGVVLHTNLGRAPLPEEAVRAAARAGRTPTDLEVDRETGRRGRRTVRAEFLLAALTGAEDALVVNNNAAALLLALAALAKRKDVLVSRGELIEIGGEFRLPDIMAASGARLVEVGTTNRTRATDYRAALSPRTGMILKVHPSNYRVTGFAESPTVQSLVRLAHQTQVPLLHDLGSGLLAPKRDIPADEPSASESLGAGADLVSFSGDKLLGGPQAGILLGRRDIVDRLRRHPIARAVRVDKMTVAALEVVLGMEARGEGGRLPVWRTLAERPSVLRTRARKLAEILPGSAVVKSEAVAGGGSLPGQAVPSWSVRLPAERPERLAARLRTGNPPVFCRVEDGVILFDLRTVEPENDPRLARAVAYALSQD